MTSAGETSPDYSSIVPPSPVVAEHLQMLPDYANVHDKNVLDVGCGRGRNSIQLFVRGYGKVLGIDTDSEAVLEAQRRGNYQMQQLRKSQANRGRSIEFLNQDLLHATELGDRFSVVAINEVLHMFPKPEQYDVLHDLRGITKPRGLHLISGYLVSKEVSEERNRERMLNPGELIRIYESAGWKVTRHFALSRGVRYLDGTEHVLNLTNVIAQNMAQI